MTLENELREKWESINFFSGGSLKLSVDHPLEWYVRYANAEQKSLSIIISKPVYNVHSSKSIDVSCFQRKDGDYALTFTVVNKDQEDVFIAMCSDIIDYSNSSNPDDSLIKVLKRYVAWAKLMERKNKALLSGNAQKGLIGELLYLKQRLEMGDTQIDAVNSWVGPDGADQDFSCCDGWHEIKTTGVSSNEVSISSLEQLNRDDDGELIVYRIDKCAPAQTGSFTLYGLVHEVLDMMPNDYDIQELLMLKLASAGYIDSKEYDVQHFSFDSKTIYCVNETFPKIVRNNVSAEISKVEYTLNLPSLAGWQK